MLLPSLLLFFSLACVIIFCTRKLAHIGKSLSNLTSLSGPFISFTLLALVTSMPELVISISAVTLIGDANLCGGDIFGSNFLNLTTLATLNVFLCGGTLFSKLKISTKRLILFQVFLTTVPMIFIFLPSNWDPVFFRCSLCSLVIVVLYLFFYRQFDTEEIPDEDGAEEPPSSQKLAFVLLRFALYASIIIIASIFLTKTCDHIAHLTGLGNSFAGALLLATISSLPEIVLTITLVRMKAFSMAFGNILGSNFFNVMIFPITDLFLQASLYQALPPVHLIPFLFIVSFSLGLFFCIQSSQRRSFIISICISLAYFPGMYLLYRFSTPQ